MWPHIRAWSVIYWDEKVFHYRQLEKHISLMSYLWKVKYRVGSDFLVLNCGLLPSVLQNVSWTPSRQNAELILKKDEWWLPFAEYGLRVTHCGRQYLHNLSTPQSISLLYVLLSPVSRWQNWGSEGKSTCFTVTQEISGRTGIQTQVCADPSSSPLRSACLISANPQTILGGRHNYSSHFTVRETQAQRDLSDLPKSIPLVSIELDLICPLALNSPHFPTIRHCLKMFKWAMWVG